jgi:hypothetical protein
VENYKDNASHQQDTDQKNARNDEPLCQEASQRDSSSLTMQGLRYPSVKAESTPALPAGPVLDITDPDSGIPDPECLRGFSHGALPANSDPFACIGGQIMQNSL